MKNFFYTTIGTIIFSMTSLQAQETNPAPMQEPIFHNGIVGVRFMPTFSSIKIQSYNGTTLEGDFVLGYGYGGLLGYNYDKHLGLQLEVIYNRLSQKYKDDNLDRRLEINYLNIPLLLSLNTNRTKSVNLNFVVGPQLGINLGAKLTTTGTTNGNTNYHGILAVKKNDFGIAYGTGLDFCLNKMKTIRLDVGFRGVMGLVDVSDQSNTIETNSYYILKKANINTYSGYLGVAVLF